MQQTNFQHMSITTKQTKQKTYEHTRDAMGIAIDTPTTATITNADNISTLLDKKQQDRTSECHRNHL